MNRSLLGGAERPPPQTRAIRQGRRGQVTERRDRLASQTTRQPVLMGGISFRYAPKRFAGASLQLTPPINTGGRKTVKKSLFNTKYLSEKRTIDVLIKADILTC